jgi:putative transposase
MDVYHVLNRGVEKKDIVKDDSDMLRFVHSLFIFNDAKPLNENHRYSGYTQASDTRDVLVYLHAWCLMPNHYHLLLSPVDDNLGNLSRFMKKLNMGYARYFNEKHDRSGYLWQGKYKKIHVNREAHFNYIPYYIHLNPLDLCNPKWRTGSVQDSRKALLDLEKYRWSSHLDYMGVKNFPSLITTNLLQNILGDQEAYTDNLKRIISSPELARESDSIEN